MRGILTWGDRHVTQLTSGPCRTMHSWVERLAPSRMVPFRDPLPTSSTSCPPSAGKHVFSISCTAPYLPRALSLPWSLSSRYVSWYVSRSGSRSISQSAPGLSFHLSLSLSVSLALTWSLNLARGMFPSLSLGLSVRLSLSWSLSLGLGPSVSWPLGLSVCLSVSRFVCLSRVSFRPAAEEIRI